MQDKSHPRQGGFLVSRRVRGGLPRPCARDGARCGIIGYDKLSRSSVFVDRAHGETVGAAACRVAVCIYHIRKVEETADFIVIPDI